jgi:hypothetical protein
VLTICPKLPAAVKLALVVFQTAAAIVVESPPVNEIAVAATARSGAAVEVDTIWPKLPAAVKFALVVFQT